MKENVAVIDPAKCVNCGLCVKKCPAKVITDARPPRPAPAATPAAAATAQTETVSAPQPQQQKEEAEQAK